MITTHAKCFALSTAILAACAAGGAPAEDTDMHNALAPCIGISNSADRLACYDKLAGRVSAPKTAPSVAAPAPAAPAPAAPAAAASAPAASVAAAPAPAAAPTAEDFGLSKVQKAASSSSPPEIKSITAKVAGFGHSSNRRTQITLDNGQVWEYQDDPDSLLSIGDSVTIKRATLGSFIMLTPAKLSHRVRRIN
jgi:nucleoid-associated protein YgaU